MNIKNRKEIEITSERKKALKIYQAGVKQVDPSRLIRKAVKYNKSTYTLSIQHTQYEVVSGRFFIIGAGKAAGKMANAIEEIVDLNKIEDGIINCHITSYKTKKIKINKSSHPVPDKNAIRGVQTMLDFNSKYQISPKDIILCLLSGGGSSMLTLPASELSLKDIQTTTKRLLESGADINEINVVRKHLSKVKGGRLGQFFSPTKIISLIISDVASDNLGSIASGPTFYDLSTFEHAYIILKKYELIKKLPVSVIKYIDKGRANEVMDTPKSLANCDNYIIGNNAIALEAMAHKAKSLGLKPLIVTSGMSCDGCELARQITDDIKKGKYKNFDVLLFGGETTLKLGEKYGKGGRCQHFAAVAMYEMSDYEKPWTIISAGSDGVDYSEKSAGAIVDKHSLKVANDLKIDIKSYIENFDSFSFFKKIGYSNIETGATETNVGDFMIIMI